MRCPCINLIGYHIKKFCRGIKIKIPSRLNISICITLGSKFNQLEKNLPTDCQRNAHLFRKPFFVCSDLPRRNKNGGIRYIRIIMLGSYVFTARTSGVCVVIPVFLQLKFELFCFRIIWYPFVLSSKVFFLESCMFSIWQLLHAI